MRGFRDVSDAWAARLVEAIPQALERAIDVALSRGVDFVVAAGDIFDTAQASYGDSVRFFEGVHRLHEAGVPLYLVPGNHDPYTVWQAEEYRLAPTARLMGARGPEFALFERGGEPLCLVGARGYRNQSWPSGESMAQGISRQAALEALRPEHPGAGRAPFCIGILHTALAADQAKAYCDERDLLAADVDLWACGHLHERYVAPSKRCPKLVFPGCIQGRDIAEGGERGCYVATLERDDAAAPARVSLEFVPVASVVFGNISVGVQACRTLADVAHHVQAQLFHENAKTSCDEMVFRVELVGETDLHEFLARQSVLADLRKRINGANPSFYCDALLDCTRPPRGKRAAVREGLFESHVLRVAEQQRSAPKEMVAYVQSEFVKRGIDVPTSLSYGVGGYNDAAEVLVGDLLAQEDA